MDILFVFESSKYTRICKDVQMFFILHVDGVIEGLNKESTYKRKIGEDCNNKTVFKSWAYDITAM